MSVLTPRAAAAARNIYHAKQLVLAARFATSSVCRTQSTPTAKASEAYPYRPGGPIIQGGVNDSLPFPEASKSHGSHHWAFERLLSAALIPLTATSFVLSSSQHPIVDGLLAVSLVIHSHIGFDSVVVDYLHTRKFPVIGRIATWLVRAATATALVGVYQFNTNDVGLTELIRRLWHA